MYFRNALQQLLNQIPTREYTEDTKMVRSIKSVNLACIVKLPWSAFFAGSTSVFSVCSVVTSFFAFFVNSSYKILGFFNIIITSCRLRNIRNSQRSKCGPRPGQ